MLSCRAGTPGWMSHDQNFKNLIVDYPLDALRLFAAEEAERLAPDVRILPVREEQLKARLSDRFRELDVPLLVEWPDGRREAVVFVVEHQSNAGGFSIHRLAHYCLDLAELLGTERVVPVVVFMRGQAPRRDLVLGGDRHRYLHFEYLACELARLPAVRYLRSENLVARLNLPNMAYEPVEKLEVYARAVQGLRLLEADLERQLKYLDFVDIYAGLDDNERREFAMRYADEAATMSTLTERLKSTLSERLREEGHQQGLQQGHQQGEAAVLIRLMERKFGALTGVQRARIESADVETLLDWSERILTAESPDEVLR